MTKISAYKSTDGEVFEKKEDCERRDVFADVLGVIEGNVEHWSDTSPEEIAWLIVNNFTIRTK